MTDLSPRRLEWLLRARGTEMAAWPAAERVAAFDLLRRSPEAQLVYAEALAGDDDAPGADPEADGAVCRRMQLTLRRRLAPLPATLRGLGLGVLIACMMAGLFLATAMPTEPDASGDLFNTAQTVNLAALDQ